MALDSHSLDLWRWLPARAAEQPEQVAVVHDDGRRLTYAELEQRTGCLAQALSAAKVSRGDCVMTLLPNSPELVLTFLACIRLGATFVPLNPQFRGSEVGQVLDDVKPRAIVASRELAPLAGRLLEERSLPQPVRVAVPEADGPWHRFDDLLESHRAPDRPEAVGPNADALTLFSSGSTGGSKPVVRTQGELAAEARALSATVGVWSDDRILCAVPLSHAHGLGNGLLAALCAGGTLVLMESFDRRGVLATLERERITIFPGVPFMFHILSQTRMRGDVDLSSLRLCFSAGAPLGREPFVAFRSRFGIPVRQLYGSTETGAVSINLDEDVDASWQSVGRPLAGVEIAIFNDEDRLAKAEEEGRVGIRSPGMCRGYAGRPDLTARSFRGGYFFPGDRGWQDAQGRIFLKGRDTLFVNVGANKVDPSEVEGILLEHPDVDEAVVLGVPGPGGVEQLKAVVVSTKDVETAALLEHCRARIAAYKIPSVVEVREEIPRSPLGKILRKYLV